MNPAESVPAGVATYLDFPGHAGWRGHYVVLYNKDDRGLAFRPEFREAHLPVNSTSEFDVELLDTTDGKTYFHKLYVAYDTCILSFYDADWNHVDVEGLESLMGYFYGSHHCPCHRKDYAREAGADVPEKTAEEEADSGGRDGGYCSGDRFQIKTITYAGLPGLILYSETMTEEELEASLGFQGE